MGIENRPSAALQRALELLAAGKPAEAEAAVTKAAKETKGKYGSGSHPLACAYADIARLHLRTGEFQRAALEFQHASKGAMPADEPSRRDRLGFMFGFAAALVGLNRLDEAEKVLRQCATFSKSLNGPGSPAAAAALAPLADVLLKAGRTAEALKVANESYEALWTLGDPLIADVIPVRAEAFKAAGSAENPFVDLGYLPDEIIEPAVAGVLARAPAGAAGATRAVLADLLAFAEKKFTDAHPATRDVLAAVAHHEARQGAAADAAVRRTAVRRAVWSFTVGRVPGGLLAGLEIGFEPDGWLHLVPHLARNPTAPEVAQLESALTEAVDDLYARPAAQA
jgi:tetratricopeptide (TPR) repeat protein